MPPSPSTPLSVKAAERAASLLTYLGVSKHALDDTLSLIDPLLTVTQLHAKVVSKRPETPAACTLVLQPGPAFKGITAGQYVMLGIEINGSVHRRAYSPRLVEGQPGCIAVTVQRQVGGKVSNFIHDQLKPGDIINIDQATGEFVLPESLPASVLMIAGGSGITPCMSMIQALQAAQAKTRVTLVYFARSQTERIFARELQATAKLWPGLVYIPLDSTANTAGLPPSAQPVLDHAMLDERVPDWRSTPAYCCGPAPLMDAARQIWSAAGRDKQLKLESFGAARPSGDPTVHHKVTVVRDGKSLAFDATGALTLLEAAEKAGLSFKHGCRQGICHECACHLNHGVVRDLISGDQIEGDGQPVRLCVSAPMSDLDFEALN
jgi:ferredoxin-NADP reductase